MNAYPAEKTMDYKFQIPIQEQSKVQELSFLPCEFRHSRTNFNPANVNNELLTDTQALQDESTSHTNPGNISDRPASKLPSFQSTFINRGHRKVNHEMNLESSNQIYPIFNQSENLPFLYQPSSAAYNINETQNDLRETNNYNEITDGSSNMQSPKRSPQKSFLNRHKLTLKEDDFLTNAEPLSSQTFKCDICRKSFTQKNYLNRHRLTHKRNASVDNVYEIAGLSRTHQDEPTCLVCGKKFYSIYTLKRHSVVHSGKKTFICDICQKRFTLKSNLKRHNFNHTGLKPFKCNVCGIGFSQKYYLNAHSLFHKGNKQA